MAEKTKTPWQKTFDPNFLGAWSLEDGEELTTIITFARVETITNPKGEKAERIVIGLQDAPRNGMNLPMVIGNKENARTLEKIAGSRFIEDWPGKKITIFVKAGVKAFGSIVEALRIKGHASKTKLTEPRFIAMLDAVKSQKFDKVQALERFELTDAQCQELAEL